VVSLLLCAILRVELGSPSSSSVPGRRTLLDGTSVIGNLTREIKYITPGADKVWRSKHSGVVHSPFSVFPTAGNTHTDFGHRIQEAWLGWNNRCTSIPSFAYLERMADPHAQLSVWPTPKGAFSIADAHAIKVGGHQTS